MDEIKIQSPLRAIKEKCMDCCCRKGAAYSVFVIKRKLFLQKYGIVITEV